VLRWAVIYVGFCCAIPVCAGDWPEFRGPGQQGHSDEKNLPVTWSETENVAWKVDIPGLGWSSPSIVGNRIWITTALDDGKSLKLIGLDRDSGKIHGKNSHASPSPTIEGDRIYLHFGRHGTACYTTQGEEVWKTQLAYEHRHGPSSSPVLFRDLVIINCDGTDTQYVVALNKHTGKEVWKKLRSEDKDDPGRMAYSTPILIAVEGQPQLISSGGEWTIAYEPATGKEIWRFRYPKGYYDNPVFYAVKLGGHGDITESHVAWKIAKGAPRNASPLIVGDEIYIVNDNGITSCLDAKTGEQHWQKRIGGDYSASPLYADGRIYLLNETGKTTVLAPGKEYEVLAENELPGRTLASISAAHGALFLRTDTSLYRLQKQ
jgi:outer membrane protein assembly factor BamB